MLKRFAKNLLRKLGYSLHSIDLSMEQCLHRCHERGLDINTVIDVGAAIGDWSKIALKYLPNAQYLLIEAQIPHQNALEKVKKSYPNVDFVMAAAGNRQGTIYFENSSLFGGLASEKRLEGNCIEVPVTTIDFEINKRGLKPPFLIKLDTHGFEVSILEGAKETLKKANLVVIEAYNYQIAQNSLRFFELCQYMDGLGFSPIELADTSLRPYDKSFWQMDIFFIPSKSPEFEYKHFK